jgi:hypothetical protein
LRQNGGVLNKRVLNKPSEPTLVRQLRLPVLLAVFGILAPAAFGQQSGPSDPQNAADENSKRIFWIVPNFRTTPELTNYQPITASAKFRIATEDAFDRGTFALAALFGGYGQLTNADRSLGQGVAGYARYFGTSYGDFMIGDYMTEAIFPAMLHQDPRFFRRGRGSGWSRFFYSAGQVFVTHGDSGHTQFNFSEVLGNSAGVAISMAYYPDRRDVGDALTSLGTQIGVDMASNILKEFAPDIMRKFSHKHKAPESDPHK